MQKSLTYAHSRRTAGLQNKPLSQLARCTTAEFCHPECDFSISSKSQGDAGKQVTKGNSRTPDAKPFRSRGLERFASESTEIEAQNSPRPLVLVMPVVPSCLNRLGATAARVARPDALRRT